jgi:hypothetical protein
MAAQRKAASSRAMATVATVERLPGGEGAVAVVQAQLGAPGAGGDLRGHVVSGGGPVLVVPGGLDEQAAGVPVAGAGDVAAVALVAGGVLARHGPEVGGQLARVAEPVPVADLGQQPERGAVGDAAERAESAHRVGPRLAAGDPRKLAVDRASRASRLARCARACSSAHWASGCSTRCARTHAICRCVRAFSPSRATRPCLSSCLATRWRAAVRARRTSSRQRTKSRSPSCSGDGGATNRSSPARYRRTSFLASRRSVLTRSPARTGTSDGATTSHAIPTRDSSRNSHSRRAPPHSRRPDPPDRGGRSLARVDRSHRSR